MDWTEQKNAAASMTSDHLRDDLREFIDCNPEGLPGVLKELCAAGLADKALAAVSYAREKYAGCGDIENLEAEVRAEIGDLSGAEAILVDFIRRHRSHDRALRNLGVLLASQGRAGEGLEYLLRSLEIEPYDRDAVYNCAVAALDACDAGKAAGFAEKYVEMFPGDTEMGRLAGELKAAMCFPGANAGAIQWPSACGIGRDKATKVVMTSGTLKRFNGGTKIYNLWCRLLRSHGIYARIATVNGCYDEWLVKPERVISYAEAEAFKREGDQVRVVTSWLDTPGLEELAGSGKFYYFDAELKWTLHFREKLADYLDRDKIAKIGTHSRYIQSWYMANYGIRPALINEWSDESVFYEDAVARVAGRIGCMPDASEQDRQTFDFLSKRAREYGRGAELVEIRGDEREVAELMRTVDIFVGVNRGKDKLWGEGCPRTQQEALHCGCALVAFDCLGNREYLYDKWTGLAAPSGDTEGLWRAVRSLLDNPDLKERLRASGKGIAKGVFSEANKYALIASFLDLQDGRGCDSGGNLMSKEALSSVFPRPFWLAEEEVPFLAESAGKAARTIVEIGCAYGGSTTLLLLNKGPGVQLYSIDPFVPDSKGGVQASEQDCRYAVAEALSKSNRNDALKDWHLTKGYSHEAVRLWEKGIDLLFIDGSHHYEDVRRDFEQWSRFVAGDGRILIHDSRKDNMAKDPEDKIFSRGWAGPTRLVEELRGSPDFELVGTCHSISVFARRAGRKGNSV
ncbi:MAG: class I SAM-dependent methyltransferase [Sedimentisphaerales bacterium]|nr:class I SAM-dependent methyltransferase [Sedimentisphaerales bacterium]